MGKHDLCYHPRTKAGYAECNAQAAAFDAAFADLTVSAPQEAAAAEAADATLPDEARGHYATAEDADYAASLHTGHPRVWPNYIDEK